MKKPLLLIAGPCVIENEETPFLIAKKVKEICHKLEIEYIFKSSWKKANRTSLDSFTGLEIERCKSIFNRIKKELDLPILTDVHETGDVEIICPYVDYLQIPAFLCRQTDLLVACAKTGKGVNIKKGQFLSAESMKFAIEKLESCGNYNILLTERGTTFGYEDLIVDFRNIPIMKKLKYPVILDATHSLQKPNQSSGITGGNPEMIETIAKCGIVSGIDGLFIETHPNPELALSDGKNMLPLNQLEELLEKIIKIRNVI